MSFFVYILFSEKANKFYVGQTADVYRRLFQHNNPESNHKFTAKYLPWKLMAYFFVSQSRADAMIVEKFIKKQKSRNFILKIIKNADNQPFIEDLIKVACK